MIRLTPWEEHEKQTGIYISVEQIGFAGRYDEKSPTVIDLNGKEVYYVTETPEEVARKVLEYKLAMLRYSEYMTDYNEKELYHLAGLEVEHG